MTKIAAVLLRSAVVLFLLTVIGGASGALAAPLGDRPPDTEGARTYTGIVAQRGYQSTKTGFVDDYFFVIPDAVARDVSVGDVLVPVDPEYQRIVFVGNGRGYCIDSHNTPGNARVAYRFTGMRDPVAAAVAIRHWEAGLAAYGPVWESRRGRD